jgi:S-adenosylhomocysteine hydrolase
VLSNHQKKKSAGLMPKFQTQTELGIQFALAAIMGVTEETTTGANVCIKMHKEGN